MHASKHTSMHAYVQTCILLYCYVRQTMGSLTRIIRLKHSDKRKQEGEAVRMMVEGSGIGV